MSGLGEIRARAESATSGPWQWFGNVDSNDIYLATPDRGRLYIMQFVRWGMRGAQPRFRESANPFGVMVKASERPIFEVCRDATERDDNRVYRGDVVGIRNGDADFIAHSRQDVDDLLAVIDAVEAVCAKHEEGASRWADPLPVPEWIAEVRTALGIKQDAEVTS